MAYAELRPQGNSLLLFSDYSPALVAGLKAEVPFQGRRWDPSNKAWIIDAMYGAVVAKLVNKHLGLNISVPLVLNKAAPTIRLLKVEYLGATKLRDNGVRSAFGYVDDGWNAIFPETVLTDWFDAPVAEPTKAVPAGNLYQVLSVASTSDAQAIKTAYRRLARQWHPDVAKEPDAKEMFIKIQHAYEVLTNDLQRRKYDAGLALEASIKKPTEYNRDQVDLFSSVAYRAPLRCGWLLCEGLESLGRFNVTKILQWEDLVNSQGLIMVSTWPAGADMFITQWVTA